MRLILNYKKIIFWQLLIFLFPFIIYLNTLQNNFLAGDDQNIILNNSYLKDWKYFYKFFTENYTAGSGVLYNYWRPFQLIVYSLIVHTAGFRPWAFHLSSILFHSLCGLLIFTIFSKLMRKTASSAIIASLVLVWLAHPIHSEDLATTTGIASPSHLFWILFGLFSFLIFEEKKRWHWYGISLTSFVFALFSKESAIVFPGLVLGMHIACVKIGLLNKIRIRDYVFRHSGFWLIALFYIWARLTFLNFSNTLNFYNQSNIFTQNLHYRLYTLFTVLTYGLKIIFLPIGLHPERSWPVFTSFFSLNVSLSFLILSAMFIIALMSWEKNPLFSFGLFWFFFSYLPMSNIFAQINALVWDHWFYTPSVGIFLSIISLFPLLRGDSYRRVCLGFLIPIMIILGGFTFSRNHYYKNTEAFCRFILAYEPESARVWNNLALSLSEQGQEKEAIECYSRGIRLSDVYPQAHHNLANIYFNSGKYDLAEREFLTAIQLDGKFFHSYLGLGNLYLSQGRAKDAAYYFRRALEIYPYLPSETVDFIKKISK